MFRLIRLKIKKRMFPEPKKSLAGLLQGEKPGQALVLLAVAFFALLAFIGLVTDVGSIYVSYTSLQRAVDAAAVAAANNIKNPSDTYAVRHQRITEAAREMLTVHRVSGISDLEVYLCSDEGRVDELGNPYVLPANFAAMCPQSGALPRKLAYIKATQDSPVYFLHIFGVQSLPLTVTAVGETAAVDLIIVMDTSESMASELVNPANPGVYRTLGYDPRNYNPNLSPNGCNVTNECHPLKEAKVAASGLVSNLFDGYDRVGIVTFNYTATLVLGLTDDLAGAVQSSITNDIHLHDDLDAVKVPWTLPNPNDEYKTFNPIYPEDRDGDGKDVEGAGFGCTDVNQDLWDDSTGEPCDQDNIADTIDWNRDGVHDGVGAPGWYNPNGVPSSFETTSILSTCSGCGLRVATETLMGSGRPGAVWVIIFLTDGLTNLSDTHATNGDVPSQFIYGFCGPTPADTAPNFWSSYCIDNASERYCIDQNPNQCPSKTGPLTFPNIIVDDTSESGPYSVEDYAFDMADRAALTTGLVDTDPSDPGYNASRSEPMGEDIVIFSVGLDAARDARAARLLRYMANIGDDGSRANDPCVVGGVPMGATLSCGNYYYAPTGAYLSRIFENIAGRIFTKISR